MSPATARWARMGVPLSSKNRGAPVVTVNMARSFVAAMPYPCVSAVLLTHAWPRCPLRPGSKAIARGDLRRRRGDLVPWTAFAAVRMLGALAAKRFRANGGDARMPDISPAPSTTATGPVARREVVAMGTRWELCSLAGGALAADVVAYLLWRPRI